jgi:hypothetical protein
MTTPGLNQQDSKNNKSNWHIYVLFVVYNYKTCLDLDDLYQQREGGSNQTQFRLKEPLLGI